MVIKNPRDPSEKVTVGRIYGKGKFLSPEWSCGTEMEWCTGNYDDK